MSAATCAFEGCQAGGDILAGAPRMSELVGFFEPGTAWVEDVWEYHPGCWDAEQAQTPTGRS